MKVIFRVDASLRMGIGHLMRCLTLADALRERGARVRFICREHKGHLIDQLRQKAIPVTILPAPPPNDTSVSEDYAVWLGVSQAEDARESIDALDKEMSDWLVVDHYGLDVKWEKQLRPHVKKLMVIDDLANRHHDCDVLLDQNYSFKGNMRYAGLVPDSCNLLFGPSYALLRPEYVTYRKVLRERNGQVNRVLVFLGGSDPYNISGFSLRVLSDTVLKHLQVDLVIGANNQNRNELQRQAQLRPNTRIFDSQPHLADLIVQADLAIGAGGATTWERMCLGLPTVVISIADNQKPASEALSAANLIYYAGCFSKIKQQELLDILKNLVWNAEKLSKLSEQNMLLVDGLGTLRLVEVLFPASAHELSLRLATEEDLMLYFHWANDPEVRKSAINTSLISFEKHQEWYINKLKNPNAQLYVLEATGLPVGQIRFDIDGVDAHIDYSLDPIVRGRGWGSRLVSLGIDEMRQFESVKFCAEVKAWNQASSSVFLREGFSESPNSSCTENKFFSLSR